MARTFRTPYESSSSILMPERWLKDQNNHGQSVLSNSKDQCCQCDVIQKKAKFRA